MSKKILICGATGFLGENLVSHFKQQESYDVYGVALNRKCKNLPQNKFFAVDLTNKDAVNNFFKNNKFDVVVQAAASTSGSKDILERPYIHVTDNALMNALVLQACYDNAVKHFIFTSCGVMYNPDRTPVRESDYHIDEEIFSKYYGVGWTKVYVEKLCKFYSNFGITKHTVMRISNAYGAYDKYDLEKSHFFGATITKVMNSKSGDDLLVWGDGLTERDLLHVSDVVDFIHKAIERQQSNYELYNVGYGKSYSVNDIVKMIISESGKELKICHDLNKPSIKTKLALISDKAKNELGWSPKTSIKDGINKTIKWYKNNLMENK